MSEEHSPERIVFFSDAVVAIALTLLVLPLAEAVPEAVSKHAHSLDVITENQWKIYSFLLSFAVIGRFWMAHHRIFQQVKAYNTALLVVNHVWLLVIVILPFPTEMVGGFRTDRFTATFYIATVLASSLCLLAMMLIISAVPGLARNPGAFTERQRFSAMVTAGLLTLALVLAVLVPAVGFFGLLLLPLDGTICRIRYRNRKAEAVAA